MKTKMKELIKTILFIPILIYIGITLQNKFVYKDGGLVYKDRGLIKDYKN